MTSRSSCLDLTLIRENFKRFWPIMAGGFLFWIVCGPFAPSGRTQASTENERSIA